MHAHDHKHTKLTQTHTYNQTYSDTHRHAHTHAYTKVHQHINRHGKNLKYIHINIRMVKDTKYIPITKFIKNNLKQKKMHTK